MNDPFQTAQPIAKKLKILLYGATGTGKTIAATSFPRSAYIDAEGGTHLYRGRKGFEHIKWLDEKTLTGIERAVNFIAEDGGKNYDTLVIDPITVIYDVLKEATAKTTKYNELGFREWAKINNRMNSLYTMLTNLPVHVIGICRESDIYETINNELKRTGVKPDADKDVRYIFDFEIRMLADHSGIVGKSRGVMLGENGKLKEVHWGVFEPIANMLIVGKAQQVEDKESASVREATEMIESPLPENTKPIPQSDGVEKHYACSQMTILLRGDNQYQYIAKCGHNLNIVTYTSELYKATLGEDVIAEWKDGVTAKGKVVKFEKDLQLVGIVEGQAVKLVRVIG